MSQAPPSLNRQFALVFLSVMLVVTASCMAIWQYSINRQLHELQESRFQFSLHSVRAALESGLRLGFAAHELPGAQELLEQARAREQNIQSIDVFDLSGRILFTTDHGGLGAAIPVAWLDACRSIATGGIWRSSNEDGNIQCTVVLNSYDQISGGVLLRYRIPVQSGVGGLDAAHWPSLALILVLLGLMGAGAGWVAVRPVERRLHAMTRAVEERTPVPDDALIADLATAVQQVDQILRDIKVVDLEVERFDHTETS
jgi:hypothetical protein